MGVNLRTACRDCAHESVCVKRMQPEYFKEKICNTKFGPGPNDDYGYDVMSDNYNICIDISCRDFMQKSIMRTKNAEVKKGGAYNA